ncbi:MAG: hypothetical protein PVF11_12165 [Desulfobacterales bacterium]|jgi:hypothetical protein
MKGDEGVRRDGFNGDDETVSAGIDLINRSWEEVAMANKSTSTKMKIKVKTKDGEVEVKGLGGEEPDVLSEEESRAIAQNPSTKHLGEVLFTHSSPG